MEVYCTTFGIILFLFVYLYVDYVARYYEWHENNKSVDTGQSHAFGSGISDGYTLQYR